MQMLCEGRSYTRMRMELVNGTDTETHLGLGPSWGPESLEEGLQNLGLGPSWGPEFLEEESTLAPTWQLKEENLLMFL